jgi:hypothetical protein
MKGAEAMEIFLSGERIDPGAIEGVRRLSDEESVTFLEDAIQRAIDGGHIDLAADLIVQLERAEDRMMTTALENDPDLWAGLSTEERVDAGLEDLGLDVDTGR